MKQVAKRGFFHRKGRVGMKKRRSKTGSVLLFLLIFLLAAFMAFPLYYTVIQSLKPIEEIFRFPPTLYVSRPVMDNYGEMFRILVGVNGVGNQTARVMLSSLTVEELREAIQTQDVKKVQRVKGIGAKTAQRIVLELADKVGGVKASGGLKAAPGGLNVAIEEAQTALMMLGFAKPAVEKLLASTDWKNADGSAMTVEEIIKEGLRRL